MPLKNPEERRKYHSNYMKNIWYPKNRDVHLGYLKNLKNKLLKYIEDLKRKSSCVDCGISGSKYPRILDFHHIRGSKKFDISAHSKYTLSIDKIKEEITKCDIVCANCHRIRTIYKKETK
jgi:hypothetical protein